MKCQFGYRHVGPMTLSDPHRRGPLPGKYFESWAFIPRELTNCKDFSPTDHEIPSLQRFHPLPPPPFAVTLYTVQY